MMTCSGKKEFLNRTEEKLILGLVKQLMRHNHSQWCV